MSISFDKCFNKAKQLMMSIVVHYQKAAFLYNFGSTFVSPVYTLFLARNINVYKPPQGKIREKYFNHNI